MKHLLKICVISLCFLHYLPGTNRCILFAQTVRYEIQQVPFTKELAGFSGTCMIQDSDGFMWFGTSNGLYRYDGSTFKIYQHDHFNENSLSSNVMSCLIEDNEGHLWIGTDRGLVRFNRVTETFKRYAYSAVERVYHVIECRDGYIWWISRTGFYRFDKTTETFLKYGLPQPDIHVNLYGEITTGHLYEDRSGILWIRSREGEIYVFNKEEETFNHIRETPCNPNNFYEDRSGKFWITSWDGLYNYDRNTGAFHRHLYKPDNPERLNNQMVRNMLEDDGGNYWISTYDGIYLYSPLLERKAHWDYPYEYNRTADYEALTNYLCLDHTGTLWYFTKEGISKIVKAYDNFNMYDPDPGINTTIYGISTDRKNNIWFTDGDVVYRYDRQTEKYRRFFLEPGDVYDPYDGITLTTNILIDKQDVLWVGSHGRGLYRAPIRDNGNIEFECYLPKPDGASNLPSLGIAQLFLDSDDRLWVSVMEHSAFYFDRDQDKVFHLVNNPDSRDQFVGKEYSICAELNSKSLLATGWYQDTAYIYEIIPPFIPVSKDTIIPTDVIQLKPELEDRGWYNNIVQPSNDSLGLIWITNFGSSVLQQLRTAYYTDKKGVNTKLRHYTTRNGLPGRVIGMFEGNRGMLWLATYGGIARFDPSTGEFMNFTLYHGLHTYDFMYSKYKSPTGELFFGTTNGLISFYPDSLRYNSHVPRVVLTGLKVNNQYISENGDFNHERNVTYVSAIDLSYDQNNLSFEFAALNYIRPYLNQYRYMLEGYNNEWIHAGNRDYVDYTNLRPGRYTFRVKGSNNDGVWNEEGATLDIHIHAPPWLTWWSYLIYGLVLMGLVLLYWRYLVSRARLKTAIEVERIEKEKVRELDQMKSRFFTSISHEFRTPLTLILGPVEDLLKRKQEGAGIDSATAGIIHRSAKRLQRLINQLLDIAKLETGEVKLHVAEGNLEEFTRTVILSFLSLAESRKIRYSFDLPGTNLNVWYDTDKVEKILVNLISNAFKFTREGGEIRVMLEFEASAVTAKPERVELTVSDTGRGIQANQLERIFDRFYQAADHGKGAEEGTGIGLALVKELVELYRGEISVDSRVGEGTRFTVRLPVSRDQFREEEIGEPVTGATSSAIQVTAEDDSQDMEIQGLEDQRGQEYKPVVLIVEDNDDLVHYISLNLVRYYRVLTAGDGEKGLKTATRAIPDLVISDVMMPGLDGMEMCRKLKEDDRTSHIPVIMLTAKADRESKLEGLKTGADDYLLKPFDAEELLVRARNLIEQRRKLRERFQEEFQIRPLEESLRIPGDKLLHKVLELLGRNIGNPEFNVDQLTGELRMSRTQMFRKIGALTGSGPADLLRIVRLKKAAELIRSGKLNITQIMYEVGFQSPAYFARRFREYYGVNPSRYRDSSRA